LAPALYERAGALVEQLFESPTDPKCWERMLTGLGQEISPDSVALVIGPTTSDGQTFVLGHGLGTTPLSSDDLLPWCDHRSLREARAGTVFPIARACPVFAATALHQNLLRPAGLAPGPGLCVVLGRDAEKLIGFVLVLSRNPNWVPRTEDQALLELLAPFLIRAVVVGLSLHERRSGSEALLGMFEALTMGVVLLDTRGEVSFLNRSAAELLGTSAGAPRAGSSGAAERKRRTAALKALTRRESGSSDAALSYPHPVDGRPLHIVSTPLHRTGAGDLPDARFASALFFGDPGIAAADSEHGLAELYHLTPAEERLALRLASGETLAVAAEKLGIRLSTARGALRSVFEKTDTCRQAELLRLVLTLVGQVRLDAPRG
jgi:DNA-binding CsgD family transcriptional regulator/PAS domain-containing protein